MKSQTEMYYDAVKNQSLLDQEFLWLVENGLTRADLQRNIQRRPNLWSRYEGWMDKLQ